MDYDGKFVLFLQRDERSISRIDLKTFECEKLFTFDDDYVAKQLWNVDAEGKPIKENFRHTNPGSRWMILGLTIDPKGEFFITGWHRSNKRDENIAKDGKRVEYHWYNKVDHVCKVPIICDDCDRSRSRALLGSRRA